MKAGANELSGTYSSWNVWLGWDGDIASWDFEAIDGHW